LKRLSPFVSASDHRRKQKESMYLAFLRIISKASQSSVHYSSALCVSVCTFVLVRQCLYFCTKAAQSSVHYSRAVCVSVCAFVFISKQFVYRQRVFAAKLDLCLCCCRLGLVRERFCVSIGTLLLASGSEQVNFGITWYTSASGSEK
jgi:hypothetical protein